MNPLDQIARCVVFDDADVGLARAVIVTSTGVAREAARRHQAAGAAAVALARGLTSGLLLATLTKDEERVTLQVLGDGPLGGLTVDATAAGTARAYVKNPAVRLPPPPPGAARLRLGPAIGGTGLVSVIRDLGLRENFSGQTALATGEIDEDVAHYLVTSEQIASALRCEVLLGPGGGVAAAAGILVQALPGTDGAGRVETARELLEGGALLRALAGGGERGGGETGGPGDGDSAPGILRAALGPELGPLQVLDVRPVRFHCPCSRERAGASLALLGPAELAAMVIEDGKAEVICNFCRARYDFSDGELETMRREVGKPAGPPS
jgi:molecular chaperone Hsp33